MAKHNSKILQFPSNKKPKLYYYVIYVILGLSLIQFLGLTYLIIK